MTKYIYNREIAVKEGFRSSTEINKGCFKRPATEWHRNAFKNNEFNKTRERLLNNITRLGNENLCSDNIETERNFAKTRLDYIDLKCNFSCTNNSKMIKKVDGVFNKENSIKIKELYELTDCNKRGINCYVEKQEGLMYTLRDLSEIDKDSIYELKLDGYYDIVGKAIFMNISKKNGAYKVNQIQYKVGGFIIKKIIN